MGAVKRSVERKFWKWMCRFFKPFVDRIRSGTLPGLNDPEIRRVLQSPQADGRRRRGTP